MCWNPARSAARFAYPPPALSMVPPSPPTGSHGKGHGNGPGPGTVQPLCSRMQPLCSILFFCTLHHIVVSEVHSTRLQKQAEAATWGKGEGAVRRVAQYAFHGRPTHEKRTGSSQAILPRTEIQAAKRFGHLHLSPWAGANAAAWPTAGPQRGPRGEREPAPANIPSDPWA